jgi:hypothetical protein
MAIGPCKPKIDMKAKWKTSLLHGFGALGLACLGAYLWFLAARLNAKYAVKEAQVPGLFGFLAFLAAIAVAASAPVFHILVRRIFIGILVFIPTFLLCWLGCFLSAEEICDRFRAEMPVWLGICLFAASLTIAVVAAIYLSIRSTRPRDVGAPRSG